MTPSVTSCQAPVQVLFDMQKAFFATDPTKSFAWRLSGALTTGCGAARSRQERDMCEGNLLISDAADEFDHGRVNDKTVRQCIGGFVEGWGAFRRRSAAPRGRAPAAVLSHTAVARSQALCPTRSGSSQVRAYREEGAMDGNRDQLGSSNGGSALEVAVLAGGCFWGVEDILRDVPGVVDTEVGYTGGWLENPTYHDTHDSKSGHAEAVRITFRPSVLIYEDLLEKWFFRLHDPTTLNQQGNDVGTQYRSAIFPQTPEQQAAAERVIARVNASGRWPQPITTTIEPASTWYSGEDYHQDYLRKNPGGYTCHFMRE